MIAVSMPRFDRTFVSVFARMNFFQGLKQHLRFFIYQYLIYVQHIDEN